MPIPVNQPGAQPQRNTRAANMNPMGYKTPSTPPTMTLPGIGMTMEEMLAMFQQLMAQQQIDNGWGPQEPQEIMGRTQGRSHPVGVGLPGPPPPTDWSPYYGRTMGRAQNSFSSESPVSPGIRNTPIDNRIREGKEIQTQGMVPRGNLSPPSRGELMQWNQTGAPGDPIRNTPAPLSPFTPTIPSYMDQAPPPPKVGNQSVPGMPAPQLSAITEMMKNTQGQAGMPPPRVQGSSPSVGQAFGPRKSRR